MKVRTPLFKWFAVLAALVVSAATALAQQRITANDNTTNKTTRVTPGTPARAHKLDLNTASKAELEALPGIGASIADAIIAARPFKSIEGLKEIQGVGVSRFEEIRPNVTVRPRAEASTTRPAAGSPAGGTRGQNEQSIPRSASPNKTSVETQTAPSQRAPVTTNPRTAGPNKPSFEAHERNRTERETPARSAASKINLNTATQEELESLPEIGPVKAQAIIEGRPYRTVEDVMKVKGIKDATFEDIRDQITVR